jgi:hypothetical protein
MVCQPGLLSKRLKVLVTIGFNDYLIVKIPIFGISIVPG